MSPDAEREARHDFDGHATCHTMRARLPAKLVIRRVDVLEIISLDTAARLAVRRHAILLDCSPLVA